MDSRFYQSGRLDWGSGKISTNSSLQETPLSLVMSPAAGSPDRIIGLQEALRGSCLLGFQLLTFLIILIKSFDLLPEQRCTLYTGSGVMYTHGMAFFFSNEKIPLHPNKSRSK